MPERDRPDAKYAEETAWKESIRKFSECVSGAPPTLHAGAQAVEAASEVFRLVFGEEHEATHPNVMRLFLAIVLECGLRRGEGCADLIEFAADIYRKKDQIRAA